MWSWSRDGRVLVAVALVAPAVVAAGLVPWRGDVAAADAALVLVLVVVAVAAVGRRVAGVVAALSAGVWFDFFLTRPYERFAIYDRTDIETAVLLLLVGVGVTELAVWGHRQQALAAREAGYLAGIHSAAESVATAGSPTTLIDQVRDQLIHVLRLRGCDFDHGTGVVGGGRPRLRHDGRVEWRGTVWDVEAHGLPVEEETELLVVSGSGYRGRFRLTATPGSRPSLAQRLLAVALADQVAAALSEYQERPG